MSANDEDLHAEFDLVVEGMDHSDIMSTALAVVDDFMDHPYPSSPPSPPVIPYIQGQNLPFVYPVTNAAVAGFPAAPPQTFVPKLKRPHSTSQNVTPVGVLNGEMLYQIPAHLFAPSYFAPPAPSTSNSKKRKREDQDNDRPYIKKPPNAFMLFRKEQRPNVVAELGISQSATVNTVLGQRWNVLSKEEQAIYYDRAEKERRLHEQQHPGWSSGDNYGKKRKRARSKAAKEVDAGLQAKPQAETKPLDMTQAQPEPEPLDLTQAHPEPEPLDLTQAQPEPEPLDLTQAQPEPEPLDLTQAQPEPEPLDLTQAQPEPKPLDLTQAQPEPQLLDIRQALPELYSLFYPQSTSSSDTYLCNVDLSDLLDLF